MRWNACCILYCLNKPWFFHESALGCSLSTLIFFSHVIDFFGMFVHIWIAFCFALNLITFVIFVIRDLSINCHAYLNLVSRNLCFQVLKGCYHYDTFMIGNLTFGLRLGFSKTCFSKYKESFFKVLFLILFSVTPQNKLKGQNSKLKFYYFIN